MAAFKITPSQVRSALVANNFQTAAGQIKGKYILLSVRASTDLQNVKGFKDLVVKSDTQSGVVVRLRDIARVQLDLKVMILQYFLITKKRYLLV